MYKHTIVIQNHIKDIHARVAHVTRSMAHDQEYKYSLVYSGASLLCHNRDSILIKGGGPNSGVILCLCSWDLARLPD